MDLETAIFLRDLCDHPGSAIDDDRVHCGIVRFGNLNLILCSTDEQMAVWKVGTERMKNDKLSRPFDKKKAIAVFQRLRELVGIEDNYVH